ncbi:MAG: HEAT repeat domain-containing protein [Planctomycetaceae bacterium]
MSRQHAALAIVLAGGCLLAGALAAFPQQADPAGSSPPGGIGEAAPPPLDQDSLLARQPTNADEALAATVLMIDLGRPQLARRYLERMVEFLGDDDDQLLALRDKHGPALFLRLARNPALQPLATEVLDRSNRAIAARQRDPQYLDAIIDGLAGTQEQQAVAIVTLEGIGPVAVPRMLQRLDAERSAVDRDTLVYTLVRMGQQVVPALIGSVDAPNPAVQRVAIDSLGWLRAPEAAPKLWRPAFAEGVSPDVRDSARKALARIEGTRGVESASAYGVPQRMKELVLAHFSGKADWRPDEEGLVTVWTWIPERETVGEVRMTPQTASTYVGLQYARDLLAISPGDRTAQALVTAFALAWDAMRVGWDQPLPHGDGTAHDQAVLAGSRPLAAAVAISLERGNAAAALASLQTLAEVATREELLAKSGLESPVLAALNFPDSRVQFAAATTVLQLQPNQPFPGSHRVVEILARALADSGASGLLVIDPNSPRGVTMADFISGVGFHDRTAVATGREGFRIAAERGDIELIAMHVNVIDWELTPTIVNLRADARTAAIPIVVYGPETVAGRVHRLVEQYPLVAFIIEGVEPGFVQNQVRPYFERLATPPLTPEQRADRSAAAAYWLATIARGGNGRLFDLTLAETALADALFVPGAGENALLALASIPTAAAQVRLTETVTNANADLSIRGAAAMQLAMHIQRHGLLIPNRDVALLRQTWETATDPGLQSTLAVVLGTLRPNAELSAERLLRIPSPRPPRPPAP